MHSRIMQYYDSAGKACYYMSIKIFYFFLTNFLNVIYEKALMTSYLIISADGIIWNTSIEQLIN